MAFSSCFYHSQINLKIDYLGKTTRSQPVAGKHDNFSRSLKSNHTEVFEQPFPRVGTSLHGDGNFLGGSRIIIGPRLARGVVHRKGTSIRASWLANSQIASSSFTLGTLAVLPFYTLMVLAPKAELTRKSMKSGIPYVVLGLSYAYLLFLSWTPDTLQLLFGSKYWLPELPDIAKMFSTDMTLASAWIHLLVVDLFAARQIYHDGLENEVETRHSVSMCLFFGPIGVITHVITKALTKIIGSTRHSG